MSDAKTYRDDLAPAARGGTTLWRKAVLGRLADLSRGELELVEGGVTHRFGTAATDGLRARVEVRDPQLYRRVALRGSVGAGESYMAGEWVTDDLTAVVRILVRNRQALERLEKGLARLARPLLKLFHALRPNTLTGSRRNIEAHYDLSNEFFALFLDETMTYSCGIFESPESSLREASIAKIDRLCRKLRLTPEDHLLEIGTGWGALAMHAASHYGCRVTSLTLSPSQREEALRRIETAGLSDRIEVRLEDYRQVQGTFDKVVSVEMIEAIGAAQLPTYFRAIADRLAPGGLAAIQAITIADRYYEEALGAVDFIQRYIFPGAFMPSIGSMTSAFAGPTDLVLVHLEDIGQHYAETLRHWRDRFFDRLDEVKDLGFDDRFVRMWEFYLCYCEGGFLERSISDVQMVLAKGEAEWPPLLGELQ